MFWSDKNRYQKKYSNKDLFCAYGFNLNIDINEFSIYAQKTIYVNGLEIELYVIGESHIINIPRLNYTEILAGVSNFEFMMHVPINQNMQVSSSKDSGNIQTSFELQITNMTNDIFNEIEKFDLYFEFDKKALTAIKVESDLLITTVHTYPEFGKTIQTVTKLDINS